MEVFQLEYENPLLHNLAVGGVCVEYPVLYSDNCVGTANVFTEGLYSRIKCECNVRKGIYKLYAKSGKHLEAIGICVPTKFGMGLDRLYPTAKLHGAESFVLLDKHNVEGISVPIQTNSEFSGLPYLEYGRLIPVENHFVIQFPPDLPDGLGINSSEVK